MHINQAKHQFLKRSIQMQKIGGRMGRPQANDNGQRMKAGEWPQMATGGAIAVLFFNPDQESPL
ncbi:hypothetical protein [Bacillus smithii]|uniref:hypothetical protein n=1 Tax=Bacillus smithii TaxID=1479 RepID=UPI003D1E45E1